MKRINILLMITFVLFFSVNVLCVLADDYDSEYEEYDEEENEVLEEGGEVIGWGTIALAGLAGVLFPLRRSGKQIKRNFPSMSNSFTSVMKFFGKWHITFGILALFAGVIHGVLMYISEGELGFRELLGIGSIALVTLAAILGVFLAKNKRIRVLRSIHISLVSAAGVITAIHILLS